MLIWCVHTWILKEVVSRWWFIIFISRNWETFMFPTSWIACFNQASIRTDRCLIVCVKVSSIAITISLYSMIISRVGTVLNKEGRRWASHSTLLIKGNKQYQSWGQVWNVLAFFVLAVCLPKKGKHKTGNEHKKASTKLVNPNTNPNISIMIYLLSM